jgi:hypothetical protein
MAVNFQSKAWQKLCYQDNDHQAHVKTYWDEKLRQAAKIGDAKIVRRPFNPQGCYNGYRDWYEQGHISPTQARYPTFVEDPTSYILSGD